MSEYHDRNFRVTCFQPGAVSGLMIEPPAQMRLKAKRPGNLKPNHGTIEIYNLNDLSREYIYQENMQIVVEAGYKNSENFGEIFRGAAELINHVTDNEDIVTVIDLKDQAVKDVRGSVISLSFSEGTTEKQVIRQVIKELNIPTSFILLEKSITSNNIGEFLNDLRNFGDESDPDGTFDKVINKTTRKRTKKKYPVIVHRTVKEKDPQDAKFNGGISLSNDTIRELTLLLLGNGLWGWIDNGRLSIAPVGASKNTDPIEIRDGLIGSPEYTEIGVKFTHLVNYKLEPGVLVYVNSDRIKGRYIIINVDYDMDFNGSPWYVNCECINEQNEP